VRTAVDTNVFSALWSAEPTASAMASLLGDSRKLGGLVICAPVYAELLAHPKVSQDFVDSFLVETGVTVEFALDESVWREAARAFGAHAARRRSRHGDQPRRLLVDFLIGAHATEKSDRLLTLDASRYQMDFPLLALLPDVKR
jgi:predicted nucleic acid-binding protein